MPAWITITADDLADYSAGEKVNALRTAALNDGQADPFIKVMPDVAATVRGYLSARPTNLLSATANSVPPEARTHLCWLVIEGLQARLPGLMLTDEEKRMIDRAWSWCKDVARGDIKISRADDPIVPPVQAPAPISVVSANDRLLTRKTLRGF